MSGLTPEQLDEIVERAARHLEKSGKPWNKGTGRPRELSLREAVIVTCAYLRQNIIEEVLAEIFDVSQATISRVIRDLTPVISEITAESRPTAEEATATVRKLRTVLVDGFLAPCWSWSFQKELWSGKHKTTGHNCQVITDHAGNVIYISDPMTGHNHDANVLVNTPTAEILKAAVSWIGDKGYEGHATISPIKKPKHRDLTDKEKKFNNQVSSLRAPVERAVAHIKTWRVLHTDYRRPLKTWATSFLAATGLYFFKLAFE
jgi:transposase